MLEVQESGGLHNIGLPKIELVLCLLCVYVMLYLSLFKGVKSTGKIFTFLFCDLIIMKITAIIFRCSCLGYSNITLRCINHTSTSWTDASRGLNRNCILLETATDATS